MHPTAIDENDTTRSRSPANGRWVVIVVIALGIALAVVGMKFRQPMPQNAPPATNTAAPSGTLPAVR
jgi:hypothetical protein